METPKDKLKKMTAWTTEPALSDAEIDELLLQSEVADAEGNAPESAAWIPTYDLNAAAASGWTLKAGRAASTTETAPDGVYVTAKVFDNCLRMAKYYSSKRSAGVRV